MAGGTDHEPAVPDAAATRRRREVAAAGLADPAGPEQVERVRAGLSDPEPAVRATAVAALARLRELALADLEAAMADPSPVVRSRAAEVAHTLGPAAAPAVVSLLGPPPGGDLTVLEAACFGLGEFGAGVAGTGAVAALAGVARDHRDALCRESAVAALGAIGDPAGKDAVLGAMGDKPAVRRRAVLALSAFDGPDVDAALEAALSDRDWQVRQAAEDLTGRRPGEPG